MSWKDALNDFKVSEGLAKPAIVLGVVHLLLRLFVLAGRPRRFSLVGLHQRHREHGPARGTPSSRTQGTRADVRGLLRGEMSALKGVDG